MYAFRDVEHLIEDLLHKAADERGLANRKSDLLARFRADTKLPKGDPRRNDVERDVRYAGGVLNVKSDIGYHASRAAAFELAAEMAKGVGLLGADGKLAKA